MALSTVSFLCMYISTSFPIAKFDTRVRIKAGSGVVVSLHPHENTINLQSHSNPLHRIPSISAAVHCIDPVPIHYHKKWPESNKQPAKQLGVRAIALQC
jgi:hypothetical protein